MGLCSWMRRCSLTITDCGQEEEDQQPYWLGRSQHVSMEEALKG